MHYQIIIIIKKNTIFGGWKKSWKDFKKRTGLSFKINNYIITELYSLGLCVLDVGGHDAFPYGGSEIIIPKVFQYFVIPASFNTSTKIFVKI